MKWCKEMYLGSCLQSCLAIQILNLIFPSFINLDLKVIDMAMVKLSNQPSGASFLNLGPAFSIASCPNLT